MRFGIFYEHQIPRPWGDEGEHRLLHDALDGHPRRDEILEGFHALGDPTPEQVPA